MTYDITKQNVLFETQCRKMKGSIKKRLMNYRNTAHPTTGKVPAELVFRKTIRTRIPRKIRLLDETELEEAKKMDKTLLNTDSYHKTFSFYLGYL